ncbi:MAG: regulatory signaling modulator protein AmpE [Pseudomonadales bacterium]|nr:regulatory signaling modulator protein AmpE [Pseudomonadales bacterium]MCP5330837.1 regulatory signaling modulator protein AmpE [Pseudomonadales bacterium]
MKFLVILAALAINHFWDRERALPGDDWYRALTAWLHVRVQALSGASTVFVVAALLVPVLALLLLLALVQGAVLGLISFCLHVALLLCLFDPRNVRAWAAEYLRLWQAGDYEAAYLLLQERHTSVQLDGTDDLEALHRQCSRYLAGNSLQRLFAVLFWYLVAGPVGALVYYCLAQLQRNRMVDSEWQAARWASGLLFALEWLPARVLALTFSLAGDFDAGFACLRDALVDTVRSGESVVTDCALAATGAPARALLVQESDDEETLVIDMDGTGAGLSPAAMGAQIQSLLALIERSQVLWVAALALLAVFGSVT